MEHMPCHMNHAHPNEEAECLYGYCLRCRNEHCAFDCCLPGYTVFRVFPIARIELPTSERPELN